MEKQELPIVPFPSVAAMEAWMKKHHAEAPGIWLRFYKKASGIPSVTYKEAVDVALCYGWIDAQSAPESDESWLQRFTPRRPKGLWSKRNTEHVERLVKEGRMQPAGLKQIEAAKADGRWHKAYDSPSQMTVPEDFLRKLNKFKRATAFFESLNKSNKYAIVWRLQTAKKPETRQKRMRLILEMLKKGEKFH